ncbi:hypothetical protein ACQJBY_026911 [Aegilops geniculata]
MPGTSCRNTLLTSRKDQAANRSFTCRSLTVYLHALELVRIGDSSVETWELVLGWMKEIIMEALLLPNPGVIIKVEGDMVDNENSVTASSNWDDLAGLSDPSKKHCAGRPCLSIEKAPYEGCSAASTSCQGISRPPAQTRDVPKPATCKNCGISRHLRTSCTRPLGASAF